MALSYLREGSARLSYVAFSVSPAGSSRPGLLAPSDKAVHARLHLFVSAAIYGGFCLVSNQAI